MLCVLCLAGGARAGETVSFRIHDQRDPLEIDEVTLVYVDGGEVGRFELGPDREHASMTVTVESAERHAYALCGRVTVRRKDGSVTTREVNGAGVLVDVADREYEAVASNDFTVFYLRDVTVGRAAVPVGIERRRACTPHVSSRR